MTRNQILVLLGTGVAVGGAIWWFRRSDKSSAASDVVVRRQELIVAAKQAHQIALQPSYTPPAYVAPPPTTAAPLTPAQAAEMNAHYEAMRGAAHF